MQDVACILQVATRIYPLTLYCEGATERHRERQRERGGKEMFGFRVGKLSALGIVPDGQSPSLYKQPLASSPPLRQSLRLSFHACCTKPNSHFAGILGENMNKLTLNVCPSSDNLICPPAPAASPPPLKPCRFQSQHTTKCRADSLPLWVVLFPIFSPPQPPHHLRRKEKTFVQKTKKRCQPDMQKTQDTFFSKLLSGKGTKVCM